MSSAPAKKAPATKTAAKPAAKTAAKTTKAKAPVKIELVSTAPAETAAAEDTSGPQLRLKDLVEKVAEATGGKRPAVKEVVDAVLATMGAALDAGHALNLPPLGKARIARSKDGDAGAMLTLKLRRSSATKAAKKAEKEPLAEDGEDS